MLKERLREPKLQAEPMDPNVTQYPLVFTSSEVIVGRGFLARIQLAGRAIAEWSSADGWWVFGVHPGAIAEKGVSVADSMVRFRRSLRAVLIDLAKDASDFATFKQSVEAFFNTSAADIEAEWEAARQLMRAGKVSLAELPKDTSDALPEINVEQAPELAPRFNSLDDDPPSKIAA